MGDNALLFGFEIGVYIEALYSELFPTIQLFRQVKDKVIEATKNNPAWQETVSSISTFAEAHGDKVGVSGGFLISAFLLYKSVTLAREIESFFDGIEELKGQYQAQNAETILLIELHERVPEILMQHNMEPSDMKKYFKEDWKKSSDYFRNVERTLDAVEDLIQSVIKAKSEADVNATFSAVVSILAGTALVVGTPVSMPVWLYRTGLVFTTGMAAGSTCLSLKNSSDAQKACEKLKELKRNLRQIRGELDILKEKLLNILI